MLFIIHALNKIKLATLYLQLYNVNILGVYIYIYIYIVLQLFFTKCLKAYFVV